jgi:ATP/maltotriose-dependent transcriptional regulator MalT
VQEGDLPGALPLLARAAVICHEADLPHYFPRVAAALRAAYTLGGRVTDAVPLLAQAMEQTMTMDLRAFQVLCSLTLGEAQMIAARLEDAYDLSRRALELSHIHKEPGNQTYALRLPGEIAVHHQPLEV